MELSGSEPVLRRSGGTEVLIGDDKIEPNGGFGPR